MRHVVTGLGQDGRSTVIEDRDLSDPAEAHVIVETIASTDRLPPRLPEMLVEQAPAADIGVEQAGTKWLVVKWPPNVDAYFHRSDTLDYDVVLRGQVTLLLEDGEVVLNAGDSVVIPGVMHGWRSGPEGCVSMAMLVALQNPADP
jgi:mannose-6-phosphate isomerase-like protein (cupin superfamily)